MILPVLAALARADCPASPADLVELVDAGARGWEARAPLEVVAARDAARAAAGCLDAVPTPDEAAAVHGLEAMEAFMHRDLERARAAARAAVCAAPGYELPVDLDPGHPLRVLFDDARAAPPEATEPLPALPARAWRLDGLEATARPRSRPSLLQLTEEGQGGGVLWSALLPAGAATPDLGHLAAPGRSRPRSLVPVLATVTGGLAVGAAAFYGIGAAAEGRYQDPSTPLAELDGLRRRTNGFGAASAATGLGALGAGLLTVVVALPGGRAGRA